LTDSKLARRLRTDDPCVVASDTGSLTIQDYHMIVTIDGVDGVGKSTIALALAEQLGAVIVRGVPRRSPQEIDTYDIESRYLSRLAEYLRRDRAIPTSDEAVFIVDRSVYSVVAQYQALGVRLAVNGLFALLPQRHLTIYLTCPAHRWRQVLLEKPSLDWFESKLLTTADLAARVEAEYEEMGLRRIANPDAPGTVAAILKLILHSGPNNRLQGMWGRP